MLDLNELEQLIAFADTGTLSKVAEDFHISTPSVTRSMKNVEEAFGVPLFHRTKNRIELNETGSMAVEYARKVLDEAEHAVRRVREYNARRKTITVKSCAPAPLWKLLMQLNGRYPEMTISSGIGQNEEVLEALKRQECDFAILPFMIQDEHFVIKEYMKEKLFVCVPKNHELARYKELSFQIINGFNFLLRSELGFWDTICRKKMPASRFLVQTDEFTMNELIKSSSLPCFVTDAVMSQGAIDTEKRVSIPMTDSEVNVTFYLAVRKKKACASVCHKEYTSFFDC